MKTILLSILVIGLVWFLLALAWGLWLGQIIRLGRDGEDER